MTNRRKIVVAVTGASGSIYARILIEKLLQSSQIEEIALVISSNGAMVMEYEREHIAIADTRLTLYDNSDMFAPIASGSAGYDTMIIVPCSMGNVGRIATGISSDLISRAADVMLKERRRLILLTRETPLSTIHLRNMTTLSECGAIIMPASPSFYSHPEDIESLCLTVCDRIITLTEIDLPRFEWGKTEQE